MLTLRAQKLDIIIMPFLRFKFGDLFTYVLNGPIHLFLLGILLMNLEVDILHNISMLQDLLQICKIY